MFSSFIQTIHSFFSTSSFWRTKKFLASVGCLILIILTVFLFFFLKKPVAKVAQQYPDITNIPHVPDQLTVKFKTGQTPDSLKNLPEEFKVVKYKKIFPLENNELQNYYQLTFKKGVDLNKLNAYLKQLPEVDSIEVNALITFNGDNTPNDPIYTSQWALKTINIEDTWAITKGDKKIIVAVVDSGIDYNHEEFLGRNIIVKGGDFNTEHGDAIGRGGDPMDIIGHGTAVAGIIGASVNNQKGIAGVNWNTTILAVKAGGNNESFPQDDALSAISSAIDQGAKIINMSFGRDGSCSNSFQALIDSHKDIIFIASAGNGACQLPNGTYRERNTDGSCPTGGKIVGVDVKNYSPASCNGVIVVGSIDQQNQRAASSNWGTKVDIAAPGVKIITTRSANCAICAPVTDEQSKKYIEASGTSLSTPYVAGVAALLLAKYPELSSDQVRTCLVKSGDVIAFDKPIGTRLNAARALKECPAILATSRSTPAPSASSAAAEETKGKLICTPEGGMDQRFDAKILRIQNNTGKEVKISYQSFLCPYKGTALKAGDHCDDFKTGNIDTLSVGVTKTYTLEIPSCTIGQLDVRVTDPAGIGCSQPNTGTPWDSGLGYVIQANGTGFSSGSCGGNTVPNAASVRVTLDSSGSTEKTSGLHMSTFKPDN